MRKTPVLTGGLAALVAALVWWQWAPSHAADDTSATGAPLVEIQMPHEMSENAQVGAQIFDAKCAVCHGDAAAGQEDVAPPLVHIIYEPSHHGDESFQRAVAQGVRSHHWPFGDMPPVDGVTRADVAMVIDYIRTLQRANGID